MAQATQLFQARPSTQAKVHSNSTMDIVKADITQVQRDRDFGRVEAWVTLDMRYHPALPVRHERVLASIPAHGNGKLRTRLIDEAKRVAILFHRTDRKSQVALAA